MAGAARRRRSRKLRRRGADGGVAVEMKLPRGKEPWQWLVRVQTADGWKTAIVPGGESQHIVSRLLTARTRKAVTVSGVSRLGREGQPARAEIENRD